jgi:hypothetical protein
MGMQDEEKEKKQQEKLTGNFFQYDVKKKGFLQIAGDNAENSNNYVLKEGGNPQEFNLDNYELYPTDSQRAGIGKEWDNYLKSPRSEIIKGVRYTGNFYETSGFGTDAIEGIVSMGKGETVIPTILDSENIIKAPRIVQGDTPGNINVVYHFHPTAKKEDTPPGTIEFNDQEAPKYIFAQSPSPQDKENVNAYRSAMPNGGAVLQISRGEEVKFLGNDRETLTIPIDVFRKPMQILR